jgi:hypothetical protein
MSNDHDNGGLQDNVFNDLKESFALATEEEYPYEAVYNGVCKSKEGILRVDSYRDVLPNSVSAFKRAIAFGPVSIAV